MGQQLQEGGGVFPGTLISLKTAGGQRCQRKESGGSVGQEAALKDHWFRQPQASTLSFYRVFIGVVIQSHCSATPRASILEFLHIGLGLH